MVVLGTQYMLELLARNSPVAADGTFKTKPGKKWSQLYSLHVSIQDRFIPAIIAFMAKDNSDSYVKLFKAIGHCMERYGIVRRRADWKPSLFLTDFELSAIRAVREVWRGKKD